MDPDPGGTVGTRDLDPYAAGLARAWDARFPGRVSAVLPGSLLKVDVSGFTRLSERLARSERTGAEEVNAVIDALWTALVEPALELGGDVLQFGGDALVVWFEGDDHELRAARAGWLMDRVVRARPAVATPAGPVRLRLSAGAASGDVVLAVVGEAHRELVALGPVATEALRCEAAASSGELVLDARLAAAAVDRGVRVRARDDGRAVLRAAPVVDPHAPVAAVGSAAAFLDPAVRRLEEAGAPLGEHRRVTVSFLHLGGTDDAVREQGAEESVAGVARVAAAVERAAAEHGVCWLATDVAEDGVVFLLVAGAPVASEDDEERLLRAASAVVGEVDGLPVRAGVHSGRGFAADVGHPRRRTYAVLGDTTNTAARLMGGAAPGEVRVSRATWEHSARDHEVTWVGPLQLKGRRTAVEVGVLGARTAGHRAGTHDLPLVGREAEQELLLGLVDEVAAGRGGAAVLLGPAGEGKSRLVEEVLARAGTRGVGVLSAAAAPYESASAFGAVRAALRRLLGVDGGDDAARLTALAGDAPGLAPLLGLPLGVDLPATPEVAALDPAFLPRRRVELLADALLRGGVPLLVVVEDAHASDRASLELLDALAERTATHPVAVLTSARDLPPGFPADLDRWRQVRLAPLDRAASRALALRAAGSRALDDLTLDRVLDESGGNPLFLRELVAWGGHGDAVPDGVEQVIAARIDLLEPPHRAVLRQAAVLGADVDSGLLSAVLPEERPEPGAVWRALDAFVEPTAVGVRFRHDLYRRVAYEGLAVRRRRALHRATAEQLAARPDPDPAALAQHLHAGQEWPGAWRWAARAARDARRQGALGDALTLVERALDAGRRAAVPPDELADAEELLGDVADLLGRYAVAQQAYLRSTRAGPPPVRVARTVKRAAVVEREGRYRQALSLLTRAERATDDPALLRAALLRRSSALYRAGRLPASMAAARRVVELADGDRLDRARALLRLEMAASELGLPERFELGRQAVEAFDGLDEPRELGNLHVNLGVTLWEADDWDAALQHHRDGDAAYRRAGDRVGAAFALNNAAEILTDQGHYDRAREDFTEVHRVFQAAGHAFGAAAAHSALGRVLARQGEVEAARTMLTSAAERIADLGSPVFAADARLRLVEVSLLEGAPDAVEVADATAEDVGSVGGGAALPLTSRRYVGIAYAQRGDVTTAARVLWAAVAAAREARSLHEVACGLDHLRRLGLLDDADEAERAAAWQRLGLVRTPGYGLGG